jgi:hypothetical protein
MCGSVQYTISSDLRDVWNCHCSRCRQFTGHHMAATAAPDDAVVFTNDLGLTWYEPADGVYYGFCRMCGSSLFWRTDHTPEQLSICAGALDQPTGLQTTRSWWTAEAADYHRRPDGLEEYDYET